MERTKLGARLFWNGLPCTVVAVGVGPHGEQLTLAFDQGPNVKTGWLDHLLTRTKDEVKPTLSSLLWSST